MGNLKDIVIPLSKYKYNIMSKELLKACSHDDIEKALKLIRSGNIDLTFQNNAALKIAIKMHNTFLIIELLKQNSVFEFEKTQHLPIFRNLLRHVTFQSHFWRNHKELSKCVIVMAEVIASKNYILPKNAQSIIDRLVNKYGHSDNGVFDNYSIVVSNPKLGESRFSSDGRVAYMNPFKSDFADFAEESKANKNKIIRRFKSIFA